MSVKDYEIDENSDLIINNGGFVTGLSDSKHIEDIAISARGEWKQTPTAGLNIANFLNSPSNKIDEFVRDFRLQLELDGYININIDARGGYTNTIVSAER